jgi:hypothetical protein
MQCRDGMDRTQGTGNEVTKHTDRQTDIQTSRLALFDQRPQNRTRSEIWIWIPGSYDASFSSFFVYFGEPFYFSLLLLYKRKCLFACLVAFLLLQRGVHWTGLYVYSLPASLHSMIPWQMKMKI